MSVLQSQQSWELRLLLAAQEALDTKIVCEKGHIDVSRLDEAYQHCEQVTSFHSRTFYVASGLMPKDKKRATRALYTFCRITDDIVDNASSELERLDKLYHWRNAVMGDGDPVNELAELAWADTQVRYSIPHGYAQQLINGVSQDFTQSRYTTFGELAEYSYGVASTVGLMAMHITGFAGEDAIPYAIKLGVALQMTNILRDVAEDWARGRIYLPDDELREFGLSDATIADGIVTDRWREFMRFQIERVHRLYDEALPGIALLDSDGRFAIGAAAGLYRAILDDIEAHDYDVFTRRAHLSTMGKLSRLPRIWWNSRRASISA